MVVAGIGASGSGIRGVISTPGDAGIEGPGAAGPWGASGGPTRRLKSEGRSLVCGPRSSGPIPSMFRDAQIRISFSSRCSLWATVWVKKNVPNPRFFSGRQPSTTIWPGWQHQAGRQLADRLFFLAVVDLEFLKRQWLPRWEPPGTCA